MGTGEASRQSLHRAQCCTDTATSRREPGEWGRGARESQACALLSLIWLHAAAMTPSPVGTLHASQAQSLLSSPIPLTQMGSTHSHILLTHTLSHTLTHSSFSLTHPKRDTHKRHTHTHSLPSHTHSRHTQAQSLQEHRHKKCRDPGAVLTHQAHGACGNSPESQMRSVTGTSTHWEPLGLLEAP